MTRDIEALKDKLKSIIDVIDYDDLLLVEKWLGVLVEFATNKKYPSYSCVDVWESRKFMPGPRGAPCTTELWNIYYLT